MAQDNDLFPDGPLELPGEPARTARPGRPPRRLPLKKVVIALTAAAAVFVMGFGVWKVFLQSDPPAESAQTQETVQTATPDVQGDVPEVSELKTFTSDHPRVEFSYPASWTVTEKDEGIRIESPEFTYESLDAGEVTGHFRVYIRQGARKDDSAYIGRGVAAKETEKLTYTSPAPGQREETNLSFFGLDTADNFAYFLIAGNYELKEGDTLGPDYGKEAETYIIAGGYSSKELKDDMATHTVLLTYFDQTNAYDQALGILSSLQVL